MDSEMELFLESKEWIDKNFNASTTDLPEELLNLWMEDPRAAQDQDSQLPMDVFMYAMTKKRFLENPTQPIEMEVDEIFKIYSYWQIKLAMIDMDRRSNLAVALMPLFSFDEKEKVAVTKRNDSVYSRN